MESLINAISGLLNGFGEEAGKKIFHYFNKTPTDKDMEVIKELDNLYNVFKNSTFYCNSITKNYANHRALYDFICEVEELSPTSDNLKSKLDKSTSILADLHKEIAKNYTSERSNIDDIEESARVANLLDEKRRNVIKELDSLISTLIKENHEKRRT